MGEQPPAGRRRTQLVACLRLGQRALEVALDRERGVLAWRDPRPTPLRRRHESWSVPISEIIAVQGTGIEKKQFNRGKWRNSAKPFAFTVHFVKRTRQHRWRCKDVTFWCTDELLCNQWICALKELLDLQTSRPKHLLVYINPYGGKRKGKRIYERKVAPLFKLASISSDVIVTEHANHAKDNLFQVNLEKYDGVVCVGGDGMFSEVMHGLIGRTQKDAGIDQNNPKAPLAQCNMRIGIIPAGSTDCICYATVGTNDPVTSALHIIVGDTQPLDVSSVHRSNTFLKYCVSMLSYGFYGDILKDSEKKRWMGPVRYDFSGFKTFLSHHSYEGTVSFLPATHTVGTPRDKKYCRTGCRVCKKSKRNLEQRQQKLEKENYGDEDGGDWTVIGGKFLAINAANLSCACPRSSKGISPAAHLADGSADLILVRKCSRLNFLRYLIRHTNHDDQFDFTFVEVYRVRKFQFTSKRLEDSDVAARDAQKRCFEDHPAGSGPKSIWNCDGEPLDSSTVGVRVHCQLMKLFARGIERNSKKKPLPSNFVEQV